MPLIGLSNDRLLIRETGASGGTLAHPAKLKAAAQTRESDRMMSFLSS
jgi:hypothetical protein